MDKRRILALGVGVLVVAVGAFLFWPDGSSGPASLPGADEEAGSRSTPDLLTSEAGDDPELVGRGAAPRREVGAADGRAAPEAQSRPETARPAPGRVVGRVLDAASKPIVGVVVKLRPVAGPQAQVLYGKTDADGWFAVWNVPEGDHHLSAWIQGHERTTQLTRGGGDVELTLRALSSLAGVVVERATERAVAGLLIVARSTDSPVAGQHYSAHTGEDGAFRFELPGGMIYMLEFGHGYGSKPEAAAWTHQRAGPFEAGRTDVRLEVYRGLDIAGEVRDESGVLVTNPISVVALPITPEGNPDYGNRRFVRSTPKGTFRVRGLPPGRYTLSFEPPAPEAGAPGPFLATRMLRGIEAGTENLVVELSAGQVIAGTVVDEEGNAVAGQGYVFMKPHGAQTGSPQMVYAKLDGKGGFRSPPLDPSTAHEVTANGFRGFMQTSLEGVFPGANSLKITLRRAAAISGRVVDEEGKPAPVGVGISVFGIGAKPGEVGGFKFGYTGTNGEFRIDGLGPYTFRVAAGGASSAYVSSGFVGDIKPGATGIVLKVKKGVPLSGRLVDAAGEPVKTHYLSATASTPDAGPQNWTRIEDDDGRFRFPGVPKGKVRLGAMFGKEWVELGEFEAPVEDLVVTVPDR